MNHDTSTRVTAEQDAPDPHVAEISLFGPGLGEAIAIHAGCGDWILVDSCFDNDGQPAALAYLRSTGVDPASVVCVVATHWDDDHIGGLAQTLNACKQATFCCSSAVRTGEFLVLTETQGARAMMTQSGFSEFSEVLSILKRRRVSGQRFPSPVLAIEGRPLWARSPADDSLSARLTALSPSDAGVILAQRALSELVPRSGQAKRRVRSPSPNRASVVLELQVGSIRALLGADLEKTADPTTGWVPILDGIHRPARCASAFKVPHHGSEDADEPRVWEELLDAQPFAILTPFTQGDIALPRPADRRRLVGRTHAYTTSAQPRRRRRYSAAVERTLRESGIVVYEADQPMGHVRLRQGEKGPGWTVELFGPASRLAA
jgi:hypothetical protein